MYSIRLYTFMAVNHHIIIMNINYIMYQPAVIEIGSDNYQHSHKSFHFNLIRSLLILFEY